ncbi:Fic family protein [Thiothrix subterranea]|uniref:Fic family protein n=1 Tax=Thiothrix subterranea TaxID=2735563 RepID=UPI00192CCBB9|nr:Fic family protein [Thiothrix subterranea]QQZ28334.1 Fic family protein [Thiothrix subterranea]
MTWNWQQPDWPNFSFDPLKLIPLETAFAHESGLLLGAFTHLTEDDRIQLKVEMVSNEAMQTSAIEGEYLNRDSVQSSIRRQFGLQTDRRQVTPAEYGIAEMMVNLYTHFQQPLSHQTLFDWHSMLLNGRRDVQMIGAYRTHVEAMQVISGRLDDPKVHFEAPPSAQMEAEMAAFVDWFNRTETNAPDALPPLIRAGIAHLYFVSIHPFEDGNGRIARALAEKALAQGLGQPTLIALAHTIEQHKKAYYTELESANKANDIQRWLVYFAETVLAAVRHSRQQVEFLIGKTRLYDQVRGKLNARQEKVVARLFAEGIGGFNGGMSAKNYISLTNASRATATRDLQELVELGVLHKTGELRYARYCLNLPVCLNTCAAVKISP